MASPTTPHLPLTPARSTTTEEDSHTPSTKGRTPRKHEDTADSPVYKADTFRPLPPGPQTTTTSLSTPDQAGPWLKSFTPPIPLKLRPRSSTLPPVAQDLPNNLPPPKRGPTAETGIPNVTSRQCGVCGAFMGTAYFPRCCLCNRETVINTLLYTQGRGVIRPYHCKICNSQFQERNTLRRHIDASHLPPHGYVIIYPWSPDHKAIIAAGDKEGAAREINHLLLPPQEGLLARLEHGVLDPAGQEIRG